VVLKLQRDLVPLSADAADAEVSVCGSLSVSVTHEYKATEVCKLLASHVVCLMKERRRKI
jgi:hypothetical protein